VPGQPPWVLVTRAGAEAACALAGKELCSLSLETCEGGLDGLFDMSGNVSEWTSECDANDYCQVKGGAFEDDDNLTCLWSMTQHGRTSSTTSGIVAAFARWRVIPSPTAR